MMGNITNLEIIFRAIPKRIVQDVTRNNSYMILTGTAYLSILGLHNGYNDIDIILLGIDDETWVSLLKEYCVENEEGLDDDYRETKSFKISRGVYEFNFLREDDYPIPWENGDRLPISGEIYLDTLEHALQAKIRLNRKKDKEGLILIKEKLESLWETEE